MDVLCVWRELYCECWLAISRAHCEVGRIYICLGGARLLLYQNSLVFEISLIQPVTIRHIFRNSLTLFCYNNDVPLAEPKIDVTLRGNKKDVTEGAITGKLLLCSEVLPP